jgi:hypothetical protein
MGAGGIGGGLRWDQGHPTLRGKGMSGKGGGGPPTLGKGVYRSTAWIASVVWNRAKVFRYSCVFFITLGLDVFRAIT